MFFYMFSTMHAYLSLLFSHFVFLFFLSFSYSSIHETHSAIYNVWFDFITTWPKYHGDKKTLHGPRRKKKRRVSNNQNKYSNIIIFGTKYELFLPPYQITFFLAFGQAKANYFVTKKFLNNPYRKALQNKKRILCSNRLFSKSKGHLLDELRVSFKKTHLLKYFFRMISKYFDLSFFQWMLYINLSFPTLFCWTGLWVKQKHLSKSVLRKRCSENIQQIYRRTPMPKCHFNEVSLQLYWNHTSAWCSPVSLLNIQNTFS